MSSQLSRLPRLSLLARFTLFCAALALAAPVASAQNSIQLFGPVDVRLSPAGTGYGLGAVVFNSTTLNLTCPANPTAVLSSTADGSGNLLVDNNINVTVIAGVTSTGPTNICTGGVNGNPYGAFQNCFGNGYESVASSGNAVGLNPDTVVANDGIPPVSINPLLVPGPIQLKIDLQDEGTGPGFYLTSSTLYLNTNCTQGGVTGPALVNGNPISSTNPTPDQLSQDFSFNPSTNQQIGFEYDLTTAEAAGGLTITDQTIPQVGDSPIDPVTFQTLYTPQTSFATANCLVHSGELLPTGLPACKLFTLQCAVGTGSTASGAQCPVSAENNEIFRDTFDGPAFTLSDIPTPGGPTFHEGIGFLMASEDWNRNSPGGPCTYEAAANLGSLPCPQNLLTSFGSSSVSGNSQRSLHSTNPIAAAKSKLTASAAATPLAASSSSGGTYTSSGRTTRPNSTFITVIQVPEDLTTVTVAGQKAGYWNNSSTVHVTLSSQPPSLVLTTLPGAQSFVASPIQSISYGLSPAATVPSPGDPTITPTVLPSSVVCPTLASPTGIPASTFTPSQQTLMNLADGNYLLYYYAQDCAGTEELHFIEDSNNNWSTSFYTYPVNIDTTPPVASTPTLSPATTGAYTIGQAVTASFNCTDALSGITQCGPNTYAVGATNSTGTLTAPVDTSSPGPKTFTVTAVDAAGNQVTSSVNYQVVSPYDNQIQFSITPQTVTYPQGANVAVQILPGISPNAISQRTSANNFATGTIKILDGVKVLDTLRLQGNGAAYDYISGLSAGQHSLSAVYSGSPSIPAGASAPVLFTVNPAPVQLGLACWNANFPYGAGYTCGAYTSSQAGPPPGSITYAYDNAAPIKVPLVWGIGLFVIPKPVVGQHQVAVSYAAQGNFAAATPQAESFTVTPAPVNVGLTPSTYYLTGGTLKLSAQVQSWSAGAPRSTGSVTFSIGNTVLGVIPVNAAGQASLSVAASALPNGSDSITATYSGGINYATGAASITVRVAHP
jgi:hypothetical protein